MRAANPFYHRADENLGVALGQTLGRALFGDPQLRQEQELHKARLRQAGASAAFDEARTAGQTQKNSALSGNPAGGLVDLFASMIPAHESTVQFNPVSSADPVGTPITATEIGGLSPEMEAMRAGLPKLAAIGAADGQDVTNLARMIAAFAGGDETARRGLVASGTNPSEKFAITPERADDIRTQEFDADYKRAVDVENIQSGDRRYNTDKDYSASIYNTDVDASTARRGQDVSSSDRRRGQDIGSEDRRYAVDNKGYDRAGAVALGNSLGRVTSTVRTAAHNKDVGGAKNSYHLESRGGRGIDIARAPGVSHAQVVQKYRNAGYTILENLDEGDHSHLALAGGPNAGKGGKGGGKPGKPGKPPTEKQMEQLTAELPRALKTYGDRPVSQQALRTLRSALTREFQKTGDVVGAADRVAKRYAQAFERRQGSSGKVVAVNSPADAAKLPKGTRFKTPDGQIRERT